MEKEKVTIIGGGHQGLSMAAHLSFNNVKCFLWNRTISNIEEVKKSHKIRCTGIINEECQIDVVTDKIDEALSKIIMITTPSSAHRDIAKLLAPYMNKNYVVILNPGRTFGILEFVDELKKNNCVELPIIAETQTIVYTCRRVEKNSVKIFALKNGIPIASYNPYDIDKVVKAIPKCIRNRFIPVDSYIKTSLENVGMILHCAPLLLNTGWVESEKVNFEYYYDGISPTISDLIDRLDKERLSLAKAMGYNIESLIEWLQRVYNTKGDNLFQNLHSNIYYKGIDAPQQINHRYIFEDVPNGLVPLESFSKRYGLKTPVCSVIIDLACLLLKHDYREIGRTYDKLGYLLNDSIKKLGKVK